MAMEAQLPTLEETARQLSELCIEADLLCYVHGPRRKLKKIPSVLRKHGDEGGFGVDPDFDPDAWEELAEEVDEALEDLDENTLSLDLLQLSRLEAALVIARALPELEIVAAAELRDDEMRLWEYAWYSPADSQQFTPLRGGTNFLEDAAVYPPYSCRPDEWKWGFPQHVYEWAFLEIPSEEFFQQWKEILADMTEDGMTEEDYQAYQKGE